MYRKLLKRPIDQPRVSTSTEVNKLDKKKGKEGRRETNIPGVRSRTHDAASVSGRRRIAIDDGGDAVVAGGLSRVPPRGPAVSCARGGSTSPLVRS